MLLREAAAGYLVDAPADWLRLTRVISGRIARHIAEALAGNQPDFDPQAVAMGISDSLLELLLAPENVQFVAQAGTDEQAQDYIAQCVIGGTTDIEADSQALDEEDYFGDVVDLGQDALEAWEVRRWSGEDSDYWDAPRISVRRIIHPYVADHDVRRILQLVSRPVSDLEKSQRKPTGTETLVRLDIIDLALYKALVAHPELLKAMTWRTFELILADVLETFGYRVELQRGTKDGGVDIFAVRSDHLGSHRYLLQAKRWSNRVSVDPVRQLLFLHSHHRVTKSCLATTSTFTHGAWNLAQQYRWQLELRDFDGIHEWISRAVAIKAGSI